MKLLEAEPAVAPGSPPEAQAQTPPDQPADETAVRSCQACGAPLAEGQEWCLACGVAVSRRAGGLPGRRPVLTVLGLTGLLLAGAVGASYAALIQDPAAPPPAQQPPAVAQVPPATAAPPATPDVPPAGTSTTTTPGTTKPLPKAKSPAVKPSSPTPSARPVKPVTPAKPTTTTTPSTTSGGKPTTTPSNTPATPVTPTPTTTPPAKPKPPAPVALDLSGDAGTIYDPYGRAQARGEAARALDGKRETSWYADAPTGPHIGVGYAVALGQERGIRSVQITTPTPGFRVEVYATDETQLPPDILDTRWAHIADKSDIGVDGPTRIVLGAGSSKYRNLLLWITAPPAEGRRVRISELKVFS